MMRELRIAQWVPPVAELRFPVPARIANFFSLVRARRSARRVGKGVGPACDDLLSFGDKSSEDFTSLAEALGELDTRIAEIRVQARSLDDTLQDRDEDRALTSAFELYRKSVDLTHASIGLALGQEEQMEQMELRLLANRDEFTRQSMLFRMLVMNIRTEAARIDPDNQAVFKAVAVEIGAMERQMSETMGKSFAQIESIVQDAGTGRAQLEKLKHELHGRAQQSIGVLRSELQNIGQSLKPCAEASHRIAELIDRARDQTGALIVSLQYQDIVRQQLEHVTDGFLDIAAHLTPQKDRAKPLDVAFLHRATRVQEKHLQTSRSAIEDAGEKITENGAALLETGSSLGALFTEMERCAASVLRDSRISELFREETNNLVQVARQGEATNARISRLLQRIEESVRVFSTEIRQLEFEVKIVALNGQIAATRVPNAGALNKLAEQTAQLSEQTTLLTGSMNTQLADTLARLQAMRDEAREVRETLEREKRDLTEGSQAVSEKLARLNERIRSGSGKVARDFVHAYERVRDLLPKLQFPALIAPAYEPAEKLCADLLAASGRFANAALGAEGEQKLQSHRKRYTMKQERDAHAAALTPATNQPPAAPAAPAASVELFTDSPSPAPAKQSAEAVTVEASVLAASHSAAGTPDLGDGVELF